MIRLTRSLLWRFKELGNVQCGCLHVSQIKFNPKQKEEKADELENKTDNLKSAPPFPDAQHTNYDNLTTLSEAFSGTVGSKSVENSANLSRTLWGTRLFTQEEFVALSGSLTVQKAVQLLKIITQSKNRPGMLLKQLSKKLSSYPQKFDLITCSDILYCCSCLSFKDEVLLDKIADDIIWNKKKFVSGSLPTSILLSCGLLKYRNCKLIDILLPLVLDKSSHKRTQGLLTGLLTLAVINYFPPYGTVMLNELLKLSNTDFENTKSYVNFVWASAALNQPCAEHISVVLSEKFRDQLEVVADVLGTHETMKKKLLQINAAAKYLLKNYKGPYLEKVQCKNSHSKSKSVLLALVIDAVSHIFPHNGYLGLNVETGAGFVIDIECAIDSKGIPLPLKRKKDGIKVAIILLTFNDLCLGEGRKETGLIAFQNKILEAKGYKVIKIDYMEYNATLKLHDRVDILRKKLEELLEKKSARLNES